MHKTFCDRHGTECVARTGYLHLTVVHRTAGGEVVGEDEYKPADLCGACIDELAVFLGAALAGHVRRAGEDVAASPGMIRPVSSPLPG